MPNSYYAASGAPSQGSSGASSVVRAEFLALVAAFDKLPALGGNAGQILTVNGGATGLTSSSALVLSGANVSSSGSITATGGFLAALGAVGAPSFAFVGDTDTGVWSPGANQLAVSTAGAQRASVGAAGNWVFAAPSSGDTAVFNAVSGGSRYAAIFTSNSASSDYALTQFNATSAGVVGFVGAGSSAVGNTALQSKFGLGTQSNHDFTVLTNNAERMRVTAAGSVGVNTNNPQTIFEASSGGSTRVRSSSSGANTLLRGFDFGVAGTAQTYGQLVMDINSGEVRIEAGFSGWGGYQTFYTNSFERMRIATNGNVTVNAPATGVAFTASAVAGFQAANFTSPVGQHADVSLTAAGTREWRLRAATTTGVFSIHDPALGTHPLSIAPGGNVTIAAPSSGVTATFASVGSGNQVLQLTQGGSTLGFATGATSGTTSISTLTAVDLTFSTDSTARVVISAAGKTTFSGGAHTTTSSQAFTATPTFNANASNVFEFSGAMTANVTSCTITGASNGQTITIRVKQDGTGSRTFAAPSGAKISGSVQSTLSTASLLTLTYSAMDARWEGSWLGLPV